MLLPPSKSHAMRWLVLAGMDSEPTLITMGEIGKDVQAMIDCLRILGIDYDSGIVKGGLFSPQSNSLDFKNSGTALRFLIAQVSTMNGKYVMDGDSSLQVRSSLPLLKSLGIEYEFTSENHLPVILNGPMTNEKLTIDNSMSSQFLSAILLMTPRTNGFELVTIGDSVSRKHSDLTWELCKATGAREMGVPWKVSCPDVIIPPDPSMAAFCKLAGLDIENPPDSSDLIGHDLEKLDLRDSNDLITPLSAILALGDGGQITGAKHATYKESNRIMRTRDLLEQFSIISEITDDGLIIEGGQIPKEPVELVRTYGDHRIQMTAVILASMCGGVVEGSNLHEVAWPSFIKQLESCGLILN